MIASHSQDGFGIQVCFDIFVTLDGQSSSSVYTISADALMTFATASGLCVITRIDKRLGSGHQETGGDRPVRGAHYSVAILPLPFRQDTLVVCAPLIARTETWSEFLVQTPP